MKSNATTTATGRAHLLFPRTRTDDASAARPAPHHTAHTRRAGQLPVGRTLLPRRSHGTFAALAAFYRETQVRGRVIGTPEGRARLGAWEGAVRRLAAPDAPPHPILSPLAAAHLPVAPLLELIAAQRADASSFPTYDTLLTYCGGAINPLGRLALAALGYGDDADRRPLADALCTALFLTRLWRDIPRDYGRGRVYLPGEDLHLFGVSSEDIAEAVAKKAACTNLRALVAFEVERTGMLLDRGAALAGMLRGRAKLDCALLVTDGRAMLAAIARQGYDPFTARPTLTRLERVGRVVGAMRFFGSLRLPGE